MVSSSTQTDEHESVNKSPRLNQPHFNKISSGSKIDESLKKQHQAMGYGRDVKDAIKMLVNDIERVPFSLDKLDAMQIIEKLKHIQNLHDFASKKQKESADELAKLK